MAAAVFGSSFRRRIVFVGVVLVAALAALMGVLASGAWGTQTQYFTVTFSPTAPGSITAGTAFDVVVTAYHGVNSTNPDTSYAGNRQITFSGAAAAPNANPCYVADSPNGGSCTPGNAFTLNFTGGISAPVHVTLVKAESTALSATDGTLLTPTPLALTVDPADATHFAVSSPGTRTAGVSFSETITARDAYENTASGNAGNPGGYAGAKTLTFSGPANSPNGTHACYGAADSPPCAAPDTASVTFTAGVSAAVPVTLFKAASTTLTAAASSPTLTGASSSFTVDPADAAQFAVSSPGTRTAGVSFSETITAVDAYGNTASGNAGNPGGYGGAKTLTFSGPANSPNGTHACYGAGDSPPCAAPDTASVTFTAGVSALVPVTLFKAQAAVSLTVTQSALSGSSSSFQVSPDAPATLTFAPVPIPETEVNKIINGPPANGIDVTVTDQYGNRAYSIPVTITVDPLSQCATPVASCSTSNLIGTTTVTTSGSVPSDTAPTGVANFSLSANLVQVGYILRATAPNGAFGKSSGFNIGTKVYPCANSCTNQQASIPQNTTLSVDGATTGNTGTTLGLALIQSGANFAVPDPFLCTSAGVPFTPAIGAPTANIDVNVVGAGTPALTVTWTLDRSIVNLNANNGAAHYQACAGAVNLTDPTNGNLPAAKRWTTRDGTKAVPSLDSAFGVYLYWGVLPDCPTNAKKNALVDPCVLSRTKDPTGTMSLKFAVPYPYDFRMGWSP